MKRVTKSDTEWRQLLSAEQRHCRLHGTEGAFTGEYYDCLQP